MKSFNKKEIVLIEQVIQDIIDIKSSIEQASHRLELELEELPVTYIQSERLYKILICCIEMYSKVLEYKLINSGNNFTNNLIH